MNLQELFNPKSTVIERRSNPHYPQTQKVAGHTEAANYIYDHWKNHAVEEYGVSMTTMPKLGINPSSKYNTPLGIYFYPGSYYVEKKHSSSTIYKRGKLDFCDDSVYIQIFKFTSDKVLEIDNVNAAQYMDFTNALFDTLEIM
jgi:hypothetical protein